MRWRNWRSPHVQPLFCYLDMFVKKETKDKGFDVLVYLNLTVSDKESQAFFLLERWEKSLMFKDLQRLKVYYILLKRCQLDQHIRLIKAWKITTNYMQFHVPNINKCISSHVCFRQIIDVAKVWTKLDFTFKCEFVIFLISDPFSLVVHSFIRICSNRYFFP